MLNLVVEAKVLSKRFFLSYLVYLITKKVMIVKSNSNLYKSITNVFSELLPMSVVSKSFSNYYECKPFSELLYQKQKHIHVNTLIKLIYVINSRQLSND